MSWRAFFKFAKSDYSKLVAILALAFYVASIPHIGFPYRLHIDEWVHIAHSNALLNVGAIFYPDPFSGQGSSGEVGLLELGYHVPLAVFQRLSGVSWVDIALFSPGLVFIMTLISVYILAARFGFGWEAAFFASFIPTTVGILGPGFMVPVAAGLMFVPLLLFLISNYRTAGAYITIGLILSYLVILHAPSAALTVIAVSPLILLSLRSQFKHTLISAGAVAFPFVVTLPWTWNLMVSEAAALFIQKPLPVFHDFPTLMREFGYVAVIFSLLGTLVIALRGNSRGYGLILGMLALLTLSAVFFTLHYGIGILYLRGLLFALLMMGVAAGAGLAAFRKLEIPWLAGLKSRRPFVMQIAGASLALAVVAATLATGIPERQSERYYDMIDEADYQAFTWIKDNVNPDYRKALLDPWKATAFTAVTERYVFARIHMSPGPQDRAVYEFLRQGSTDTSFLRQNGISIIYTRVFDFGKGQTIEYDIDNPDLIEVRKNIYVVADVPSP